jgi:hypothetical protein
VRTIAEARIIVLVVPGGWSPIFDPVGAIAAELTGGRHAVPPAPHHGVQMAAAGRLRRNGRRIHASNSPWRRDTSFRATLDAGPP